MSIQLRHAVNAKRGASAAPFSWKWPVSPASAAPLPREEGEPGPRRPLAPRTNPANNAPAQRAAQLPGRGPGCGTQRGPRTSGVAGGWGRPRGKTGPDQAGPSGLGFQPRASSAWSAEEPAEGRRNREGVRGSAGAGRQREGPRGAAEWGVGAGWGPGRRHAPEIGGRAAFGEIAPPHRRVGALSVVLAVGWSRGTKVSGGPLAPTPDALGSCHGNKGGWSRV